jgi:hypothetical protein
LGVLAQCSSEPQCTPLEEESLLSSSHSSSVVA